MSLSSSAFLQRAPLRVVKLWTTRGPVRSIHGSCHSGTHRCQPGLLSVPAGDPTGTVETHPSAKVHGIIDQGPQGHGTLRGGAETIGGSQPWLVGTNDLPGRAAIGNRVLRRAKATAAVQPFASPGESDQHTQSRCAQQWNRHQDDGRRAARKKYIHQSKTAGQHSTGSQGQADGQQTMFAVDVHGLGATVRRVGPASRAPGTPGCDRPTMLFHRVADP